MKIPADIARVYFLGIGGIGMSALARYFVAEGKIVAGYDKTPSPLTEALHDEGMSVHFKDSPGEIPVEFHDTKGTLVIFTPAIPPDLKEMAFFKNKGHRLYKRSEVLGILSEAKKTVAVAGTHGKTTVSTMTAVLLSSTTEGCSAFLGGISKDLNSNFIYRPQSRWMVAEADEYDRSFLKLNPYASVITAMDPDHLDIYGNTAEMRASYAEFARKNDPQGFLVIKKDIPLDTSGVKSGIFTYSLNGNSDFHAANIKLAEGKYIFDLYGPGLKIENISLTHPGMLNVENAVAACAVASLLGVSHRAIAEAMRGFSGILRRFDIQIMKKDCVYIDDYGHHPREIEATLTSVKELFPGRKITGIFQPHLFTRTRDLAGDFAKSLSMLDELILLDIYPAREEPIPGVTSEMILRKVTIKNKMICPSGRLLEELGKRHPDILVTMGAGDIDRFVKPIKELYS
jgi:UDP-N-acetylmuramate--alanine ligase